MVHLADFGVSEMFVTSGDDSIKTGGGSPAFLAPECVPGGSADIHGKPVDIWAFGVTLYCMLTGKLPFNVADPMALFTLIRTTE
jgi:[calcium/calmodulin-dependent protein kinase] kinase